MKGVGNGLIGLGILLGLVMALGLATKPGLPLVHPLTR
jgi:hypothetical protein